MEFWKFITKGVKDNGMKKRTYECACCGEKTRRSSNSKYKYCDYCLVLMREITESSSTHYTADELLEKVKVRYKTKTGKSADEVRADKERKRVALAAIEREIDEARDAIEVARNRQIELNEKIKKMHFQKVGTMYHEKSKEEYGKNAVEWTCEGCGATYYRLPTKKEPRHHLCKRCYSIYKGRRKSKTDEEIMIEIKEKAKPKKVKVEPISLWSKSVLKSYKREIATAAEAEKKAHENMKVLLDKRCALEPENKWYQISRDRI